MENKKTIQQLAESGELGVEGFIAFKAIDFLGVRTTDQIVSSSILATAKKLGLNDDVEFTELYFIEEMIFVTTIILELQDTKNYLSKVISICMSAFPSHDAPDVKDVYASIISLIGALAKERMLYVGIQPTIDVTESVDHENMRLDEYAPYLKKLVSCAEIMPNTGMSIGLEPRDNPIKLFLGKVSDNICESLKLDIRNTLHVTHVQYSVLTFYSVALDIANKILAVDV